MNVTKTHTDVQDLLDMKNPEIIKAMKKSKEDYKNGNVISFEELN